ncbi:MAG: aminopeptidase, partial [Paraglaciecola sp.]
MTIKKLLVSLLTLVVISGCNESSTKTTELIGVADKESKPLETQIAHHNAQDYHSFSNPDVVKVTHLNLDLSVDFTQQTLSGNVSLDFQRMTPDADTLILDTRDLVISKVVSNGNVLEFNLANADNFFGAALSIKLPSDSSQVTVYYNTSSKASGVQWLT